MLILGRYVLSGLSSFSIGTALLTREREVGGSVLSTIPRFVANSRALAYNLVAQFCSSKIRPAMGQALLACKENSQLGLLCAVQNKSSFEGQQWNFDLIEVVNPSSTKLFSTRNNNERFTLLLTEFGQNIRA